MLFDWLVDNPKNPSANRAGDFDSVLGGATGHMVMWVQELPYPTNMEPVLNIHGPLW